MANDSGGINLGHIFIGGLGVLAGAWWSKNQADRAKQSRSEAEAPELVEEVCTEVIDLLDDVVLREHLAHEDEYREDLAALMREELPEFEIEAPARVGGMEPDILIDGVLALELKRNPNKSERDRCVGQCLGYARRWVTWVVLFETPESRAQDLEYLLADHGLEHILVIRVLDAAFAEEDEEDWDGDDWDDEDGDDDEGWDDDEDWE